MLLGWGPQCKKLVQCFHWAGKVRRCRQPSQHSEQRHLTAQTCSSWSCLGFLFILLMHLSGWPGRGRLSTAGHFSVLLEKNNSGCNSEEEEKLEVWFPNSWDCTAFLYSMMFSLRDENTELCKGPWCLWVVGQASPSQSPCPHLN